MKNIKLIISFALAICLGASTLYAQGEKKQPKLKETKILITPAAVQQIRRAGLEGDTMILKITGGRVETNEGVCDWSAYWATLTPISVATKTFVVKGGDKDTFFMTILPPVWKNVVQKPDTLVFKFVQPTVEKKKNYGLHFFLSQSIVLDFGNKSQINRSLWLTTRLGIETNPWGKPWDFKIWGGFYPKKDFKGSFELPTVGPNPTPDQGWCDCELAERSPEFSVGASVSRRIPLAFVGKNGELGLRPEVSADLLISGRPIPKTEEWSLPGAVEVGVSLDFQTHLLTPKKEKAGATATFAITPSWDIANKVFSLGLSAKVSVGTKWGAKKQKRVI